MTPEILIVGDPAGRRMLADQIAAVGYAVSLCSPRELNRRVRTSSPPVLIVACMGDVDADVLLAGLRRTRAGASIPVILYGRLGGPLRDLADVLDLGADAFLGEPASDGELRSALGQFVRPPEPRAASSGRRVDERMDRDSRDSRDSRDDRDDRDDVRRRPRGEALGELHRTLDRLEASLRSDDHPSDPELSELGFDRIPDVDPPDDPLVTEVGEHLRKRVRDYEPVRGDDLGPRTSTRELGHSDSSYARRSRVPEEPGSGHSDSSYARRSRVPEEPGPGHSDSSHARRSREAELPDHSDSSYARSRTPVSERARPRTTRDPGERGTERLPERSRRAEPEPDHDTGPGRRSWRDEPSEQSGTIGSRDSMRTRSWDRSEHEGPIRRGRELREDPPGARGSRSSAVLLGRRPDRESRGESDSGEGTARFRGEQPLDPAAHERHDPHARDAPWPEDDFDPSESTMIRRERSTATTRRRSLGGWSDARPAAKPEEPRDFPWGRGDAKPSPTSPASTARGRAPSRPEPRREREQALDPEFTSDAPLPIAEREPEPARTTRRSQKPIPGASASLRIDPSLRESGKLGADIDVATVLWALHDQRFTGKLRLVRARVEKQIWLHDGEAVFARSTATSDRLVDGLLRRGVLTRPQYETARRLAAKEPRRAGQLLVDAGFLKARELDVLLRDHLARVIDSTFVWTDGSWSTEPGDRTDEPIQLEVPMAALILDGIRYRCDASELEDRLNRRVGGRGPIVPRLKIKGETLGADERAAVEELIESLGETFRLLPEEESWLRRFDGRHGVAALLADGADEQALFALLMTLDLAGCVDLREQPEPVAEGSRDPSQIDGERILERLRLAREADYFELLGVGRDASRSEIRQAHSELGATFSDEAIELDARHRHARELRELRAALEEARDILSDDAMRSAYLAHLGDGA